MAFFGLTPYEEKAIDFFKDFFADAPQEPDNKFFKINVNVEDQKGQFILTADLPGFNRKDINIEVDNDVLTIKATHCEEEHQENQDKSYVFKERRFGNYLRQFDVSGIKTDEITGSFKNGVLQLVMPKKDEHVKTSKQIAITGEDDAE